MVSSAPASGIPSCFMNPLRGPSEGSSPGEESDSEREQALRVQPPLWEMVERVLVLVSPISCENWANDLDFLNLGFPHLCEGRHARTSPRVSGRIGQVNVCGSPL